jgi:glutamate synthase domain-containing protein 1
MPNAQCLMPNFTHPDHDACGVGFIASTKGEASHHTILMAAEAIYRLAFLRMI